MKTQNDLLNTLLNIKQQFDDMLRRLPIQQKLTGAFDIRHEVTVITGLLKKAFADTSDKKLTAILLDAADWFISFLNSSEKHTRSYLIEWKFLDTIDKAARRASILTIEGDSPGTQDSEPIRKRILKRKPLPKQILRETRDRYIAKMLADDPNATLEVIAKKLQCNKSTVCRSISWRKKDVLSPGPRDGFVSRNRDGTYAIDGID